MSQFPGQNQEGQYEDEDEKLQPWQTVNNSGGQASNYDQMIADFVAKNGEQDRGRAHEAVMDEHRRSQAANNLPRGEARNDQQSSQNSTPAQSWNSAPAASPYPDWYRGMMEQQLAQQQAAQAETKQRADSLYTSLDARAKQGLSVNANDPIIKGQVDAFSAGQERSRRNYLSDVAERSGPYANIRGEQRMTAEKVGQGTSAFQAELLGRELSARREEIADALAMQGSLLSGDQTRNLQAQLAQLDQAIKEAGIATQRDLGFGDLDLRDRLGTGQLALGNRQLDSANDNFLRELALREWDLGDQSDYRWASL